MSTINIWSDGPIDWHQFDKAREKQCGPRRRASSDSKAIKEIAKNNIELSQELPKTVKTEQPTQLDKWVDKQNIKSVINQTDLERKANEHLLGYKRKRSSK